MNIEIRKATAADAEKVLDYCKIIGSESDNLTFGAEGVPFSTESEALNAFITPKNSSTSSPYATVKSSEAAPFQPTKESAFAIEEKCQSRLKNPCGATISAHF